MSDPVRGPLGRLSEQAARALIAAAWDGSHVIGVVEVGELWESPTRDALTAALAELREKVLR